MTIELVSLLQQLENPSPIQAASGSDRATARGRPGQGIAKRGPTTRSRSQSSGWKEQRTKQALDFQSRNADASEEHGEAHNTSSPISLVVKGPQEGTPKASNAAYLLMSCAA